MFEFSSRYFTLETTTYTLADGRQVSYKRRRFLPQGDSLPLLVELRVARGDPLQFWRIADANNTMQPATLTEEPGATVRVPVPQAQG